MTKLIISLPRQLRKLDEIIHITLLAQCLAHNQHLICVAYYGCHYRHDKQNPFIISTSPLLLRTKKMPKAQDMNIFSLASLIQERELRGHLADDVNLGSTSY